MENITDRQFPFIVRPIASRVLPMALVFIAIPLCWLAYPAFTREFSFFWQLFGFIAVPIGKTGIAIIQSIGYKIEVNNTGIVWVRGHRRTGTPWEMIEDYYDVGGYDFSQGKTKISIIKTKSEYFYLMGTYENSDKFKQAVVANAKNAEANEWTIIKYR
jgi:hypothetical protein